MTGSLQDIGAAPLLPQNPCFSLSALSFRAGLRSDPHPPRFHFFWARNALFHGLRALGIRSRGKILVPAYVCAAAIGPMEYFGVEVQFYAVRRNCEPDWADLASKIDLKVRAILAVHYFGFPCDILRFRAVCDRNNLFLIEDCAHVL